MVAALLVGLAVGLALGAWASRRFWPTTVAVALEAAPVERPTTLERFVSHPPPLGALELADEAAGVIDDDGLAAVTGRYVVEAYGRGVHDLRAALLTSSGLPPEMIDEACSVAIASMGVRA